MMKLRNEDPNAKKDFGRLLKSIRGQLNNLFPQAYTQEKVAEKICDLANDPSYINNKQLSLLENGRHASISSELLSYWVEVFDLTMRERRELFGSAFGVSTWQGAKIANYKPQISPEKILGRLEKSISNQPYPAYIFDHFSNIVFSNQRMLTFYNFQKTYLEKVKKQPFGFNLMSLYFRGDEQTQKICDCLGRDKDSLFSRAVYIFYIRTLRYRQTDYFKKLFDHLSCFPQFLRYWRESFDKNILNPDWIDGINLRNHYKDMKATTPLKYLVVMPDTLSPYGELYSVLYIPCTPYTNQILISDDTASEPIVHLSVWPPKLTS